MANIHEDPAALKALQDSIYRERVLRARRATPEQRFADGLELTNGVFERMLAGAMAQKGSNDVVAGWVEVRRRLERLARVHEAGRYTTQRKACP